MKETTISKCIKHENHLYINWKQKAAKIEAGSVYVASASVSCIAKSANFWIYAENA